jgi:anaerobic selenocysteine-containing dehydrogenase
MRVAGSEAHELVRVLRKRRQGGGLRANESLADDGQRRVVRGFKARPYAIPRGSIGAYYPETNPLLPLAHHDAKSKTPAAKSIPVVVRPQ